MANYYDDENFEVNTNDTNNGYYPNGGNGGYYNGGREVPQGSNNAGNVLNWMEKVAAFLTKYGIKNLFVSIMILFMTIIVGYYAFNPGVIVDKINQVQIDKHNNAVKARLEADPQIRTYLVSLRNEIGADRVYVLETHNGGSNLANLPFLYVDLTYAEPNTSLSWLEEEYKNLRLSRYPWANEIYVNGYWFGPIEDIRDVDPELYYRLQKENVKYMGMMMMYGKDAMPSGTLGLVFSGDNNCPTRTQALQALQKYTTMIAVLLANDKPMNSKSK